MLCSILIFAQQRIEDLKRHWDESLLSWFIRSEVRFVALKPVKRM